MTADPAPELTTAVASASPTRATSARVTPLRSARRRGHDATTEVRGPAPARTPEAVHRAAAGRFIAGLIRAVHEVTAGLRPYPQLEPWLAPTVARRLGAELRSSRPRPAAALTIRSVHVAPPTPSGALEATAVLEHGGRVRALAVRLERHHDRWRATELTAPEWGYAPLATASLATAPARTDAFDEAAAEAAARDRLARAAAACQDRAATHGDAVVVALSSRRGSA